MTVYLPVQQKVQNVDLREVKILELQNTEIMNLNLILTIQGKVMANFLFRKIFRGNLNEAITLFRFPRKTFLKRKLTIVETMDITNCKMSK